METDKRIELIFVRRLRSTYPIHCWEGREGMGGEGRGGPRKIVHPEKFLRIGPAVDPLPRRDAVGTAGWWKVLPQIICKRYINVHLTFAVRLN